MNDTKNKKPKALCAMPYCEKEHLMQCTVAPHVIDPETQTPRPYHVDMTFDDDGQLESEGTIQFPVPACMRHMPYFMEGLVLVQVDEDGKNPRLYGQFMMLEMMEKVAEGVAMETYADQQHAQQKDQDVDSMKKTPDQKKKTRKKRKDSS